MPMNSPRRVTSGLPELDAFLDGGYPVGVITRITVPRDPSYAFDVGRPRIIAAALEDEERLTVSLTKPSLRAAMQALIDYQPDLLVLDGLEATSRELTMQMKLFAGVMRKTQTAVLILDDKDNALALRFYEHVRFSLFRIFEEAAFTLRCVKTTLNARQGHHLTFPDPTVYAN